VDPYSKVAELPNTDPDPDPDFRVGNKKTAPEKPPKNPPTKTHLEVDFLFVSFKYQQ
jgi:hypothetical protein